MKHAFLLLILSLSLIFSSKTNAQFLSPEAKISILTCNPGEDVYSMYGHTAIRINDPANKIDIVYNYGVFSFDAPNFMYRFAKGQTDYLIIGQKFSSFIPEYQEEKRSVYEQVLNLPQNGKEKLLQALVENARPENRIYRYNFFMDNCATRVRDMIEKNSGVVIHFPENNPSESYREMIKQYHHGFRWIDLGIDLLVGKKAEETVSSYGQMFLPEYLMEQFAKAEITVDGTQQPLVSETNTLVEYPNSKLESSLPWPAIVFGLFFTLIAAITISDFLNGRLNSGIDFWFLLLSGFAGLIISWFTLYSEHPAMSPNYNLLWAFPLNFFFALIWRIRRWRKFARFYFYLSGLVLLSSLVSGQQFNPAVYFIMLTLLVRYVANMIPARELQSDPEEE